jgi:hypothetical protein
MVASDCNNSRQNTVSGAGTRTSERFGNHIMNCTGCTIAVGLLDQGHHASILVGQTLNDLIFTISSEARVLEIISSSDHGKEIWTIPLTIGVDYITLT